MSIVGSGSSRLAPGARRIVRDGAAVLLGKVAVALAGLIGVRVLTEVASPSVYGGVALLVGLVFLGRGVFVAPILNAQLRFDPEYARAQRIGWFTHQMRRYAWAATGLFVLAGSTAYMIWTGFSSSRLRPALLLLLVLFTGLQTAKEVRVNRLNASRQQSWAYGWLGTEAWLLVAFPAAALLLHSSTEFYLAGLVAGTLAALLLFGGHHQPAGRDGKGTEVQPEGLWTAVARYGLPFIPLALFGWVSNLGDRYLIGVSLGAGQVGQYVAAYGLASQPLIFVGSALTSVLRPILFEASAQDDRTETSKILRRWALATGVLGIAAVALIAVAGGWIADIFLAAPYRETALSVMTWIGAGYALMIMGQMLEHGYMVHNMTSRLIVPTAAAAVSNVVLNLLLIPRWGIVGAAVATAGAFGLQFLLLSAGLILVEMPGRGGHPGGDSHAWLPWPLE